MALNMQRVASIILGGGQGTRLYPLTALRCKPAISFAGRYRLIDVPVSNSINSSIHKIFIITQFLSTTLHRHLLRTYRFDAFSSGFIELLAAEQKPMRQGWFQGTADAVRQNVEYFIETPVDYFLILSGDQLYNIDFQAILNFAQEKDSDLTICSIPVTEVDASRMGILKVNKESEIQDFCEKPSTKKELESLHTDTAFLRKIGVKTEKGRNYLASMGIYVFKRQALLDLLQEDQRDDFGKHLIPTQVKKGKVSAFLYDGYWEDVGTVETFYKANLALTSPDPDFNCYDESNLIYTGDYNLPGPKITKAKITNSILCEGSIIEAKEISHSILGPRSIIKKGTVIRDSYVMGNNFYKPPIKNSIRLPNQLCIGENCVIKKAIIDKNVYIGNGVKLTNEKKLITYDQDPVYIRDGIIIVTRGASLPDGFTL